MTVSIDDPAAWARSMASRHVLVVGDAMLDRYWHGDAFRISPEAPVPVVQVRREEDRPGGAANVAVNIRALGGQATLRGVVGDDADGRRLRELLHEAGVHDRLGGDASLRTTLKLRVVARSQQMLRADFEQGPSAAALATLWQDFLLDPTPYDAVLFSDYAKGALRDVQRMIEQARARGLKVLVDPKGRDYARYRGADLVTPNRAELQAVVGPWSDEQDLQDKARGLCAALGFGALLLTRSEEGMTLFELDRTLHVPAQQVEIADVTGAGDTVIAVMAMMVAAGVPLAAAVRVANRAGGLAVTRFGTSSLSPAEVLGAGAPEATR
jgi:rfaE bifunctional protein kinase chain/domain